MPDVDIDTMRENVERIRQIAKELEATTQALAALEAKAKNLNEQVADHLTRLHSEPKKR